MPSALPRWWIRSSSTWQAIFITSLKWRCIFSYNTIPLDIQDFLRRTNPWWEGKPGPVLPSFRRWAFEPLLNMLEGELAPVTVLRGPRQVGKTTLQEQLIEYLIENRGVEPKRILRIQFDDLPALRKLKSPLLSLSQWFEDSVLGETFNEAARHDRKVFLFFDEVQNLADWAVELKSLVDHNTVSVLVTGSSSLRIAAGKDSLAGRLSTLTLGTLLLWEIAAIGGLGEISPLLTAYTEQTELLDKDMWHKLAHWGQGHRGIVREAFSRFSERGGYPLMQKNYQTPWSDLAKQLNESVVERAIEHDLRLGDRGRRRDGRLLQEVFRLTCRYAGQQVSHALFSRELKAVLDADVTKQKLLSYLEFLDGSLLIRLIPPLEIHLKKQRAGKKICLCDHGIRASWLGEKIPLTPETLRSSPELSTVAGHLVESIVGAYLKDFPRLRVDHLPARNEQPEVDFIATVGDQRIPIEVKYQRRIDPLRDTLGLKAFIEKSANRALFGILITQQPVDNIDDPRIIAIPLEQFLLLR